MRVVSVVAAYDEVANVETLTRRLHIALGGMEDCIHQMIFVVEGRDGTREVLARLTEELGRIQVLYHRDPLGLGEAFRRGFEAIPPETDYVVTMDADLNHQPEEIPSLLAALHDHTADVVVGSRFLPGSRVDGAPLWKSSLSRVVNLTLQWLHGLGIRDKTSGFRVYRASVLKQIGYESSTFSFLPELLLRIWASGYRIVESPIHFVYRREGRSKMFFWPTVRSYLRLMTWQLGATLEPRKGPRTR